MQPIWMADEMVGDRIRQCRPAAVTLGTLAFGVAGLMAVVNVVAYLDAKGLKLSRVGEWGWREWSNDSQVWILLGWFLNNMLLVLAVWAASVLPLLFGLFHGRVLALAAAVAGSGAMLWLTGLEAITQLAGGGTIGDLVGLMPWDLDILGLAALALVLLLRPGSLRWFVRALDLRRHARAEDLSVLSSGVR